MERLPGERPERKRRVRTARTIFQWKIARSERPERERRAAPPSPVHEMKEGPPRGALEFR